MEEWANAPSESAQRHASVLPENFSARFPPLLQSLPLQPVSPDLDTALRRRFPAGFSRYLDGANPERGRVSSPICQRVSEP
jgi:hypothetical protein